MKLALLLGLALAATATTASADSAPLPMEDAQSFVCADGLLVTLNHDETAGVLRGIRDGEPFTLQQEVSRKGIERFVNGSDSIVFTGKTIQLKRRDMVRQSCHLVPEQPVAGTLWGTVSAPNDLHLPAGAQLKVLLLDGGQTDAPAVEIASTTLRTTGNQSPFWFLIRYDPNRALAPARPLLRAYLRATPSTTLHLTRDSLAIPDDGAPAPSPLQLTLDLATAE